MEKIYTVWVGGTEVNDYLLTEEDAIDLANHWINKGYDNEVKIVNTKTDEELKQ